MAQPLAVPSSNSSSTKANWAALGWSYLFFWYFTGFTHLLIQLSDSAGFNSFRQAMLMSMLWLVPLLAFPRYARLLTGITGGVLWVCSLVGLGYFCIYGQEFSQSVMFILFESNLAEGTEYLDQYFAWWMPLVFLAYTLGGWLLWKKIRPIGFGVTGRLAVSMLVLLTLIGQPLFSGYRENNNWEESVGHLVNRMEPAVPWQLVFGYTKYRQQLDNVQHMLATTAAVPPLRNLTNAHEDEPSTIVLVIGESTNRERMSLYGYPRATTPQLDALRSELDIFENVITPRPYTIEALEQVLTFADQQHPEEFLKSHSLVTLMKQAGYKTFWITNQQTMTRRNTLLTVFSEQADEQIYLNHNRNQNARQYDDDVLAPFADKLKDPAEKKFIVVHLLGTHMGYRYRYPESAEVFAENSREAVPAWVKDDNLALYNQYDNAVRFNDYVVSQLIKGFSATDPNGFLLYLSDHGESVFDAPEERVPGRNEASPVASMYTIPFVLWRSPKWQAQDPRSFRAERHRLYSSSDLVYTFADLAGLNFEGLDFTKSLVSHQFKQHPLLIGNPKNPDQLIEFTQIHSELDKNSSLVLGRK